MTVLTLTPTMLPEIEEKKKFLAVLFIHLHLGPGPKLSLPETLKQPEICSLSNPDQPFGKV